MQYTQLGNTGLSVSRLCLGAMTFGSSFNGIGEVRQDLADRLVSRALGWLLQQEGVSTVILGAKKMDQLEDNLGAVDVSFTDEEMERLDDLTKPEPQYPQWMIAFQNERESR